MHYLLYFRNEDSLVTTKLQLGCKNDERALAFVADITPPKCSMELWQDARLVTRVGKLDH